MEKIEINRNSWFFKLVSELGGISDLSWRIEHGHINSCQYNTAIITAILMAILMGLCLMLLTGVILVICASVIAWIIVSFQFGFFIDLDDITIAGLVIIGMTVSVGLIAGIIILSRLCLNKYSLIPKEYTDLYASFKEKHCKKIVFKQGT